MKNVLEVIIYIKTEIAMKINSIIMGALMFMNNNFLITVIKFFELYIWFFAITCSVLISLYTLHVSGIVKYKYIYW
jgi:hypothetical protein